MVIVDVKDIILVVFLSGVFDSAATVADYARVDVIVFLIFGELQTLVTVFILVLYILEGTVSFQKKELPVSVQVM
jgi:hypothetical protein